MIKDIMSMPGYCLYAIRYIFCAAYITLTRFLISLSLVNYIHYGTVVEYNGKLWFSLEENPKETVKLTNMYETVKASIGRVQIHKSLSNISHNALAWWDNYAEEFLWEDIESAARCGKTVSTGYLGRKVAFGLDYNKDRENSISHNEG